MTPLSEHEKRQLRLLESQLQADDPKFVKTMRTKRSIAPWHRPVARNVMFAVIGFFVGIPLLFVGLIAPGAVAVSMAGVAIFLAGMYFAVAALAFTEGITPSARIKRKSSFMADLESKWDERKRNDF